MPILPVLRKKNTNFPRILENFAQMCVFTYSTFISYEMELGAPNVVYLGVSVIYWLAIKNASNIDKH